MSYRELAKSVANLHNKYGASIVSVKDGTGLLEKIFELQLRVKEDAPTYQVTQTHLTPKLVRQAFWSLKAEREWELERGVVWTGTEGDNSFVGLGVLVPSEEPLPALTKTLVIEGEDEEDGGRDSGTD